MSFLNNKSKIINYFVLFLILIFSIKQNKENMRYIKKYKYVNNRNKRILMKIWFIDNS